MNKRIQRNSDPPTEAYKGLFKGFSDNLNVKVGKTIPQESLNQKATHFEPGWNQWQQNFQSIYGLHFDPKSTSNNRAQIRKQDNSTVEIGCKPLAYPRVDQHFQSEQQKQFPNHGRVNRARPFLDKQQLLAAQIVLGDDKLDYKTTNIKNLGENLSLPKSHDTQYKQKGNRFDIITNQDADQNRVKNACSFDYWNQDKDKKHQSFNYTDVPKTKLGRIDPITNRFIG